MKLRNILAAIAALCMVSTLSGCFCFGGGGGHRGGHGGGHCR